MPLLSTRFEGNKKGRKRIFSAFSLKLTPGFLQLSTFENGSSSCASEAHKAI
jgi:hypothetical protein